MEYSLDQVNRMVLTRQGLLERRPPAELAALVAATCGLQAQVPTAPALGLWSRLQGFTRHQYDQALATGALVRTWTVRGTRHVIVPRDLPLLTAGIRGLPPAPANPEQGAVLALLRELGPRNRAQLIAAAVDRLGWPPGLAAERFSTWGGTLRDLAARGLMVDAAGAGPTVAFAPVRDPGPVPPLAEAEGAVALRYLDGYGPATAADLAYWAGWTMSRARAVLERVRGQLAEVRAPGVRAPLWLPAADAGRPAPADPGPAPRFLPAFDVFLLGHRDKERYLAPAHRPLVFRPGAWVEPVLLVGGRVAAVWQGRPRGRRHAITVSLLVPLPGAVLEQARAEAENLVAFQGAAGLAFHVEAPGEWGKDHAAREEASRLAVAVAGARREQFPPGPEAAYVATVRGSAGLATGYGARSGARAYPLNLPGCSADGPSAAAALAALPAAAAAHVAWLRRNGFPAPDLPAAWAPVALPPDLAALNRTGTLLPGDLAPLGQDGAAQLLALLSASRADLLALTGLRPGSPGPALTRDSDLGRCLDDLWRLEVWLGTRALPARPSNRSAPLADRLAGARARLEQAVRAAPAGQLSRVTWRIGEAWTVRKVLRMALEQELRLVRRLTPRASGPG